MNDIDEKTTEQWESGELGRDAAHVRRASIDLESEVDRALAMKLVTIRLPIPMIDALKTIADYHGVGYQPMVRDLLGRFVHSELHMIMDNLQRKSAEASTEKTAPVDNFMRKVASS